jgi:TctA family transporter
MNVELDVSLLYHAEPQKVRTLYLGVGDTYEKTLLLPELQSAVRGLTSEVRFYSTHTSVFLLCFIISLIFFLYALSRKYIYIYIYIDCILVITVTHDVIFES